jgi:transposase
MPDKWDAYGKIRAMHVNGVSDRKIAKTLGIGRRTVRKYRDGAVTPDDKAIPKREAPLKDAVKDDVLRMLRENASLPRKQRWSARDIWQNLVSDKGVAISEAHVRRIVHELRDAHGAEFIPLQHEMGDCIQFDWFDAVAVIGGVKTDVSVFVAILPYSKAVCAFVYPDKTMLSFLHGHVKVFEWLSGIARRCLYDNLRTAVLYGSGKNVKTQTQFANIERHYAFTSEFCNVEAGWEKSNVENAVKVSRREAFVPMPHVDSYGELQDHISLKLLAYNRSHKIQGERLGIWDMFMEERASLAPLPLSPYEVDETVYTKVRPDQTVIYDKIHYSVPHGFVGKHVTLRVSPFNIKVYCRGEVLYTHERMRSKGMDQYILDHYLESLSRKPRAAEQALPVNKGVMPPQCRAFLELCPAADAKKQLVSVMMLARDAGAERVLSAMDDAIGAGKPTLELVRYYLYGQQMPKDAFEIEHADLADYDLLIDGGDKIE